MKTAVEWLLENLISEPHSEKDFKYNSECWEKALEMEKEQIMKTAIQSYNNCILLLDKSGDEYIEYAKQYYNETFKSE